MIRIMMCLASFQNSDLLLNRYSWASLKRKNPRQKISTNSYEVKILVTFKTIIIRMITKTQNFWSAKSLKTFKVGFSKIASERIMTRAE